MLTREGWLVGAVALVLIAVGRLFGLLELFVLGIGLAALLLLSALFLAVARLDLSVGRRLEPPQVHAGTPSRVELQVTNRGKRKTRVVRLRDPVTGTRGANLLLSPMTPGEQVRAAYQLPTARRGLLAIGPLEVVVADPFGLTSSTLVAAGRSDLTVLPAVDEISALPMASGHDPDAAAQHPNTLGQSGDDFYALRDYVVGDDLRRVHWRSSARSDKLLVRQDELPWQGRSTLLLDVRSFAHTPDSFELAVSATASIVTTAQGRGDHIRLMTTDGSNSGFGIDKTHLDALMRHLALVETTQGASLQGSLDQLLKTGGGGSLIVILTGIQADELQRLTALSAMFRSITVVLFEPSSWDPALTDGDTTLARGSLVRVTAEQPFRTAWNRAAAMRSSPVQPRRPANDASSTSPQAMSASPDAG